MRRGFALVLLALAGGIARADEPPRPPVPPVAPAPAPAATPTPTSPTPEQAADAVLAAVKVKDDAALKALAAKDAPGPWLVADELIRRGEFDAADGFAKAAPRVDIEKLHAYVASRRGKPDDPARRERLAVAMAALAAGEPQAALEALGPAEPAAPEDIVGIRLVLRRGSALAALARGEEAAALLVGVGQVAERLGWLTGAVRAYADAGSAAKGRSDYPTALLAWQRIQTLSERLGDRPNAARAQGSIATLHMARGDNAAALVMLQRTLVEFEALGKSHDVAATLLNVGGAHHALGEFHEAVASLERAVDAYRALGEEREVGAAQGSLGEAYLALGEHARARACFESARAAAEARGDAVEVAMQGLNLGALHFGQGEYARALALEERALGVLERLGDRGRAARCLSNIGAIRFALGDYANALTTLERVLDLQQALGAKGDVAGTLGNLASVLHSLGEYRKSLALHEQALHANEALGDHAGVVSSLSNIGIVLTSLGEVDQALAAQERALAMATERGYKPQIADVLAAIGGSHRVREDWAAALAYYRKAEAAHEKLGDKAGATNALSMVGEILASQGDLEAGRTELERAVRTARSLRMTSTLVTSLSTLAEVHLAMGAPGRALAAAQQALRESEALFGGLGEEEGAQARARHARLYRVGAAAAAREGDLGETLAFLESGRAGALLDALDKRETLRWKAESLSEDLRAADSKAQAAERSARQALDRAARDGDRAATRAASAALDAAIDDVRAVDARIQRQNKRAAGLFYPRAKTLEEIQATLEPGDALVLYGLCLEDALALVVEPAGARLVALGRLDVMEPVLEGLSLGQPGGDPSEALARVRALLVDPLGLGVEVKTVLVSPEGPLCFLPWGALLDRPVVVTPSGTTHAILRDEPSSGGEGVLALGDPDYSGVSVGAQAIYHRGRPLAALPATRAEAQAVGTTVLVGAQASEDGFRSALATTKRWKAVHFACHGLIDPKRPTLSSLALSRAGEQDGFLTAQEVLRMQIPADLAALSACETGTGKLVGGEGIVGLTRAFMYAGTPRVLCSLWKVDDDATRALMTKFYELWNPKDGKPGLPTAEALRKAQEFVKSQEKWKHPYYWAAWVLWGFPQ